MAAPPNVSITGSAAASQGPSDVSVTKEESEIELLGKSSIPSKKPPSARVKRWLQRIFTKEEGSHSLLANSYPTRLKSKPCCSPKDTQRVKTSNFRDSQKDDELVNFLLESGRKQERSGIPSTKGSEFMTARKGHVTNPIQAAKEIPPTSPKKNQRSAHNQKTTSLVSGAKPEQVELLFAKGSEFISTKKTHAADSSQFVAPFNSPVLTTATFSGAGSRTSHRGSLQIIDLELCPDDLGPSSLDTASHFGSESKQNKVTRMGSDYVDKKESRIIESSLASDPKHYSEGVTAASLRPLPQLANQSKRSNLPSLVTRGRIETVLAKGSSFETTKSCLADDLQVIDLDPFPGNTMASSSRVGRCGGCGDDPTSTASVEAGFQATLSAESTAPPAGGMPVYDPGTDRLSICPVPRDPGLVFRRLLTSSGPGNVPTDPLTLLISESSVSFSPDAAPLSRNLSSKDREKLLRRALDSQVETTNCVLKYTNYLRR